MGPSGRSHVENDPNSQPGPEKSHFGRFQVEQSLTKSRSNSH
jgi:hypothetical protein